MKQFNFKLFDQPKQFWAPKNDFVRQFIKSNPQMGYLKLSDLKDRKIVS